METLELFETPAQPLYHRLGQAAMVVRGFALPYVSDVMAAIEAISSQSPFRHMVTPNGFAMSVALTNCGALGWTSDRQGYRYTAIDPQTHKTWPSMPKVLTQLATEAALTAGFKDFTPDACLINRYCPGARLSLHQDKNERDYSAPIVSVSLGMPARFLFGGHQRTDPTVKVNLHHGDVVVWGGVDRYRYHGVMPIKDVPHVLLGNQRINLTFRKAG